MATGWGSKTWGASDWGDLSNETVSVSGISLTSTIGTEAVQANADVSVTGIELTTTNAGATAGISFLFEAPSLLLTSSIGDETVEIGVPVTTAGTLTPSIGTATVDETILTGEGWGRSQWGSFAWGDNYSVQVTGIELTSTIGDETAFADFTFEATGLELTLTQGPISLQIDQDIFVLASEDQLDAEIGSVITTGNSNIEVTGIALSSNIGQVVPEPKLDVPVTGISLTSTLGEFTLVQSTNESVTGQELTLTLGEEEQASVYPVTGVELTSSIGSVTVIGVANIDVTGIQMTISAGSVNVTAWQEINPGVDNVWSEVDLAA